MWLKNPGKINPLLLLPLYFRNHSKHPNTPARIMITQTSGEEESFETQSLEPGSWRVLFIYIYWMWGSPSIHLRWTFFHSSISNISISPGLNSRFHLSAPLVSISSHDHSPHPHTGLFLMIQEVERKVGHVDLWRVGLTMPLCEWRETIKSKLLGLVENFLEEVWQHDNNLKCSTNNKLSIAPTLVVIRQLQTAQTIFVKKVHFSP